MGSHPIPDAEYARSVGCRWSLYPGVGPILLSTCCNISARKFLGGSIKASPTPTKRVAAKSIAAIPAESIPFIGVAVLIADTGYELEAACETVRNLDQLYSDLGMARGMQSLRAAVQE